MVKHGESKIKNFVRILPISNKIQLTSDRIILKLYDNTIFKTKIRTERLRWTRLSYKVKC